MVLMVRRSATARLAVALACLVTAASLKPSMRRAPARSHVAVAKKLSTTLATAALSLSLSPLASLAFGPETIELTNMRYEDTNKKVGEICAGRPLKPPGEKVAAGLLPKCVAVTATASSKYRPKGATRKSATPSTKYGTICASSTKSTVLSTLTRAPGSYPAVICALTICPASFSTTYVRTYLHFFRENTTFSSRL